MMSFLLLVCISVFPFETPDFWELDAPIIHSSIQNKNTTHGQWSDLLKTYVEKNGEVNYRLWSSDQKGLDAYLNFLKENSPDPSWAEEERFAYWINTYNAFTIKLILDNYPIASIMDIDGGKPWDRKWIEIGDHTYSLNEIEHEILRKEFSDPRFHFAINCAAASCPPLLNEAFEPGKISAQLDTRTTSFINDRTFNEISNKRLKLSKIFEWYGKDFPDLKGFIDQYTEIRVGKETPISYQEYDWALNGN